jgi:spore coat N-acetylmuramic acid deacetylase
VKQQKIGFTRFIILSLFVIFICLCAAGCNKEDIPKNSGIVIFSTPARYSAEAKATGNLSASPVITPSSAATGTATPTPSPTPAPTPVPTPVPTLEVLPTQGTIIEEFFELPIDFDDPTVTETFNGRTPLKQIRFKVCDPENKQNRSTERVGHWFGKDTPAQPKRFQQHYEEMGWSALTVDMKTTDKILYLTFDCGYENGQTIKILDTLKEKNVPAAFFVTMDYLVSAPDLAARMIAEGHIVGNHSDKHPDFSKISRTRMASELQRVENYLRTHFGYSTRYFRYPMGAYSDNSMDLVTSLGYHSIFWSFAYDDYTEGLIRGKEYAFDKVTKSLHPGEVLLLHAISQDNADALGDIIDYAYAQGYEFRTLKQYFG